MRTATSLHPGIRLALLLAAAITGAALHGAPSAFAATPSQPGLRDVYPVPGPQVRLDWVASSDASGHALTYHVYRHTLPITVANIGALSPATSTVGTSVSVAASSAETTQSYVWWYAVRAQDSEGVFSSPSRTYSANPHGYRMGMSWTCQRCHEVHGAYPPGFNEKTPDLCYVCHGRTDADSSASYGDKSTLHVQGDFYDYPDQTPGSRHRNAAMTVRDPVYGNRECSACHLSHLSPYLYQTATEATLTSSFRYLLTVQTGVNASGRPTYTAYSRLSGSRKNEFCFACHGASGVNIAYPGGSDAYAASGGDHNESVYATQAAHGSAVVLSNDHPGQNPAIQCLACHNKHASPAEALVDYRASGTTDAVHYSEAGLCFACHSASSVENLVASGFSAPFSWNRRDVEAEFGRVSSHPSSTTDSAGAALRCTSCHNAHFVKREGGGSTDPLVTGSVWDLARASDPANTTLSISDRTAFCLRCHDGSPPSAQYATGTVVPISPVFRDLTAPYFPGWDKAAPGFAFTSSGHYTSTAGQKALCYMCHDPHGSDMPRLAAWTSPLGTDLMAGWSPVSGSRANTSTALSREENLCYQCHGNGTTGRRATGAKDVATKAQLTYGHNPADYTDLHSDEETADGLAYSATGNKRHAECVDCHDPHVARTLGGSAVHTTGESTAGAAVYGAWGVDPSYGEKDLPAKNWTVPPASSYEPTRIAQSATSYEAFLCFKCHSGNTTLTPGYTDQALEFNPSNFSKHNVLGQSIGMDSSFTLKNSAGTTVTVTWALPAASSFLQAGWTLNSKMTCTDCHDGYRDAGTPDPTTLARGPHGSTVQWLLDPDYTNWTSSSRLENTALGMTPGIICAKCHTGLGTVNSAHSNHNRRANGNAECRLCHIGVPHGWKRPRLLGYMSDPAPYATTGNGLTQISVGNMSPTSWAQANCNTQNCSHTKTITPYWP